MRDSRKCVHQKKGAKTFWTATWLAPKGKTLRRRLRHSQRHIAKLRSDKVQQSAKREIKRRYRVVQSFRSRELMLRLSRASLMEVEGSGVSSTYSPRLRPLWTSPRHQTGGSRYMRGVVTVSTRALAPAFGLRSSALLPPPQRVKASQLAVKQLNAYVEGVFDCR